MANIPPMPKPEDFGITPEDYQRATMLTIGREIKGSQLKIEMCNRALDAWKEIARAMTKRVDGTTEIDFNT